MPKIILETPINAPIERCYNLSLSVDLHQLSTAQTKEYIVAGVKEGVLKLGDSVTWRAKHLGFWQELTSKITEANEPFYFVDEMQKGIFKSLKHEHFFIQTKENVLMKDVFSYESPLGFLGKLADKVFLENYLKQFLRQRNLLIKQTAESENWKNILRNNII